LHQQASRTSRRAATHRIEPHNSLARGLDGFFGPRPHRGDLFAVAVNRPSAVEIADHADAASCTLLSIDPSVTAIQGDRQATGSRQKLFQRLARLPCVRIPASCSRIEIVLKLLTKSNLFKRIAIVRIVGDFIACQLLALVRGTSQFGRVNASLSFPFSKCGGQGFSVSSPI